MITSLNGILDEPLQGLLDLTRAALQADGVSLRTSGLWHPQPPPFMVQETAPASERWSGPGWTGVTLVGDRCDLLVVWRDLNAHWSERETDILDRFASQIQYRLEEIANKERLLRETGTVVGTDADDPERLDRTERARLALVLEGIDLGTWFCDLPLDNLVWDDRCKAHFGLAPDAKVTIATFFETIVPEDRESTQQAIERSIASGETYDTVYRTRSADGQVRWIRALGRASYDANRTPISFDGLTLDVTRRHQLDHALQVSEERCRSLIQATAAIVWISDAQGHFRKPQTGWSSYTGQSFEEHQGEGWIQAFHPQDRAALRDSFLCAVQDKRLYRGAARLWNQASGAYRHFELRSVPLLDRAGQIREWMGTAFDVQERREAELAALESNRLKTEFLANMSHELRTPMTGVRGMLEILFDTPLSDEQRDCLATIEDCAKSLTAVLDDVLDLSRIEAGDLVIHPRPFHLHSALASTLALFRLQAKERTLKLSIEIDDTIPPVLHGDPDRIRQILVNLVSNAMKFTPEGGVALSVSVSQARVRFEVCDTGIGISPDDLDRLFVPFQQLDSSARRNYEGTGLGLSIVRHLVHSMDGELGIESDLGLGTRFWFELPLVKATIESTGKRADESSPNGPTPSSRILLVEDNPINRQVVHAQLTKLGHQVTALELGTLALPELLVRPYDLILMDCQMPQQDGYETTRQIRQSGVTTPIVALTAHAMVGERERCLGAGMDDYLTKPLSRDELVAALSRWLLFAESA